MQAGIGAAGDGVNKRPAICVHRPEGLWPAILFIWRFGWKRAVRLEDGQGWTACVAGQVMFDKPLPKGSWFTIEYEWVQL